MNELKDKIRTFIVTKILLKKNFQLHDEDPLLDGIIDSLGIITLSEYLKDEFSVTLEDYETIIENLATINAIAAFVEKQQKATE